MIFGNDEFLDYMGYRNMVVEEKIEKCLAASRRGDASFKLDRGDLDEEELRYLQTEVLRRLRLKP